MHRIDFKTNELIAALPVGGAPGEKALKDWFRLFPESLWRVAGSMFPGTPFFVQRLLAADEAVCAHLCNPDLLSEQASRDLAKSLIRVDRRLDIRLAQAAVEWAAGGGRRPLRRCLAILEALSCGSRVNSALVQLLKCDHEEVRSKVVELLVLSSTNEINIREWLRDPDPRVRANVIQSLALIGDNAPWIRGLLLEHLGDRHGRPAANAAIGLYRMGLADPGVVRLTEMARSADASMRCSAAWAMGQIPDERLAEAVHQLRSDPDARVRWLALRSLSGFNRAGVKLVQAPAQISAPEPAEESPAPQLEPAVKPSAVPYLNTRTFGRLI